MGRRKMLEIGKALFERLMKAESPLPLSKIQEEMGTHFDTLKHHLRYIQLAQGMPKVTVRKVGRQIVVETEKTNEDIEFLKEIIGEKISTHVYLLVDLYDSEATALEKALPLSFFSLELKLLDEQAAQQRVIITTSSRVYLTPLGVGIAKGAKRYMSLTHARRVIPPTTSFQIPILPHSKRERFRFATTAESGVEITKPKVRVRQVEGKVIIEISIKDFETAFLTEEELS